MSEKLPDIAPFQAWYYDLARAKAAMSSLVCPPYDVIDEKLYERLATRSPFNAVHLILPEKEKLSELKKGSYTYQAQKKRWQEFKEQGVLVQEEKPALYLSEQVFSHPFAPEKSFRRLGVIALLRLTEFGSGKVMAHENTLSGPKVDRLNLMRALKANMSPIFGLFSDAENRVQQLLETLVQKEPPRFDFTIDDPEPCKQRLWAVSDSVAVRQVCEALSGAIYIADGHHRYETALNYARELARETPYSEKAAPHYMPIFLNSLEDKGLLVLPTHRLVFGLPSLHPKLFLEKLRQIMKVEALREAELTPAVLDRLLGEPETTGKKSEIRFILKFAKHLAEAPDEAFLLTAPSNYAKSTPLHEVGVTFLQDEIFAKELAIDQQDLAQQRFTRYTRDPREAVEALNRDEIQAAFFVQAPSTLQVKTVCEAGLRMPQKSTFFYPKVLTGLIFRAIEPTTEISL